MSTEFDFRTIISSQTSIMGDLRQLLSQGEYAPFTSAPVFESKFVQVNRRGETMNIHKQPTCVTIGICATNPSSPMPYGMLLAHTVPVSPQESVTKFQKFSERSSQLEQLALSRFLPLKFVELSVHSTDNHQLMLKLVNGRSYYLELCAPPDQQHRLFQHWLQLISLLKPQKNPSNANINIRCKDSGTSHEKDPSPNNSSENRANPQDLPNPKTEEEVVPKQTTSNQVPLSVSVGPTENSGREEVAAFASPLEATRQEIPMQSKNIDPLDTIMSKSKEKRKSRIDKTKPKKEKKSQPSGMSSSNVYSLPHCYSYFNN
ncbi:FA71D protein, partial [Asarcornis scutulata]|nr:FA71D protein [Asarcornis scutulata]